MTTPAEFLIWREALCRLISGWSRAIGGMVCSTHEPRGGGGIYRNPWLYHVIYWCYLPSSVLCTVYVHYWLASIQVISRGKFPSVHSARENLLKSIPEICIGYLPVYWYCITFNGICNHPSLMASNSRLKWLPTVSGQHIEVAYLCIMHLWAAVNYIKLLSPSYKSQQASC